MSNILKFIALLTFNGIIVSTPVFADTLPDADQYNDSAADSPLDNPYIVSKVFYSMSQIVSLLNSNGISSIQKNNQQNEPTNQPIKVNSTYRDFINKAAQSFGYSWILQGSLVVFTAINPIVPKPLTQSVSTISPLSSSPTIIVQPVSSSTIVSESKPVVKPLSLPEKTGALTKSSESSFPTNVNQSDKVWELNSADKTVRVGLSRWATKAGWQLIWKANYDMPVEASVSIPGTFEFAVNEVCRASQYTGKQLIAEMHDKNKVIVIYTPAK